MASARDGKSIIEVPKLLVDDVRELLSDDEMSNDLFPGREFSDQYLAKHLVAVIHDFNAAPPPLNIDLSLPGLYSDDFKHLKPWVIEAAVGRALKFGAIRAVRNAMQYSAGSISFDPNANGAALLALGNTLWAQWEERRNAEKVSVNCNGGYAVTNSDFLVREIWQHGGIISITGNTF